MIKFTWLWLLFFAFAASCAVSAQTDNGEIEQKQRILAAKTLVESSGAKDIPAQMANQVLTATIPRLKEDLASTSWSEDVKNEVSKKFIAKLLSRITSPEATEAIIGNAVKLFAEAFTTDELNQLVAFSQTPVAKKQMQLLPGLMTKQIVFGQTYFETLLGKDLGIRLMQETLKEMGLQPK